MRKRAARPAPDSACQPVRGNISRIITKVSEERGIDLSNYRPAYLERRVGARLRSLELQTYRQYADRLDEDDAEYTKLLDTITINVTEFFRDQVVWDSLRRNVLRTLVASKQRGRSRNIRMWSAACATGEEPYSLAMLLLDELGDKAGNYLLSVTGTDLDPQALAVAQRGVYDLEKLKRIPPTYQVRFTERVDATSFRFRPEVRRLLRFSEADLFGQAPLRSVDVVMCRNVFIYFDRGQQASVLDMFWKAMARNGYLVLGRSEKLSPDMATRLVAIDGKERIYQKPSGA